MAPTQVSDLDFLLCASNFPTAASNPFSPALPPFLSVHTRVLSDRRGGLGLWAAAWAPAALLRSPLLWRAAGRHHKSFPCEFPAQSFWPGKRWFPPGAWEGQRRAAGGGESRGGGGGPGGGAARAPGGTITGEEPGVRRHHEAAPRPAAPGAGVRLAPAGRQQDPQPVPGPPRPSRHPGPPRQPGPAGPRRPRRPRRRPWSSGRERRGREAGTAGPAWGARASRRRGARGGRGARGRVRGGPALRLQRPALRGPRAPARRRAAALRPRDSERAGPLRRGHGQVHLPGARGLLLRRARHRLPRQPAVRPGQERRVHRLLLPVLWGVAQAGLAVGGRHGEAGARGPGVGAGGRGRLHRHLRQRQDGQHLLGVSGLLRLAQLPRLRVASLGERPLTRGGGCADPSVQEGGTPWTLPGAADVGHVPDALPPPTAETREDAPGSGWISAQDHSSVPCWQM